ncbi:MAG: hypothetical protein LBQ74_13970 [Prevotella sp.]|jgi:hypothetical protein|nr:hypothetical protein [Prevotella sp.]
MENNIIPTMTDPLGKYWDQPDKDNILIDDSHAVMNKQDFDRLADYSLSQPSGVYAGKMWKALYGHTWYLCWFGVDPEPGYCSNNYRKILMID